MPFGSKYLKKTNDKFVEDALLRLKQDQLNAERLEQLRLEKLEAQRLEQEATASYINSLSESNKAKLDLMSVQQLPSGFKHGLNVNKPYGIRDGSKSQFNPNIHTRPYIARNEFTTNDVAILKSDYAKKARATYYATKRASGKQP